MTKQHIHKCRRCKGTWMSNNPSPKYCGKCRNKDWEKKRLTYRCRKCNYTWKTKLRGRTIPQKCPKCFRPFKYYSHAITI